MLCNAGIYTTIVHVQARKLEQAGYAVTIQPGHGYIVTNPSEQAIATPTSLNELRALADQLYELVWLGYRRVETA